MRIVFDHQCFHDQPGGGISRYITALARGLAEQGHVVTVFAGFTRSPRLRAELGPLVRVVGCVFYRSRGGKYINFINRAWFSIWSWFKRADIYHPTYYRLLGGPRKAQKILTIYDFIHERFPDVAVSDPLLVSLKAKAIACADATICISHVTYDDLVRYFPVASARASVIYLGASLSAIEKVASGRPYVLYVGMRRLYKNFAVLADAFGRSLKLREQYDLICVGGEPEFTESLIGVHCKRVQASDEELAALYAGATAFVCPSRYEGFGLPIIEAMNCGCPVVTTRCGSLPEIAGDAAEYFDPDCTDELIDVLERVTKDSVVRARMICIGRQRAARFTWDRCVKETLAVYLQAVEKRLHNGATVS